MQSVQENYITLVEVEYLKSIDVIFVTPRGLEREIAGAIITSITHGEDFCGHAAVRFADIPGRGPQLIEATLAGVGFSDYNKYDGQKCMAVITIETTDEQYDAMVVEAIRINDHGYKYGLKECVAGGLADNLGEEVGEVVSYILNCDGDTMDCSEVCTRLLQKGFADLMQSYNLNVITPEKAFKHTLMYASTGRMKIISASYSGVNI